MRSAQPADQQDDLLRLTARLYHMDGLSQAEIAEMIGLSRQKVSRILDRAREQGIVRISVEERDPRHRQLEEELRGQFKLNHILVIRTLDGAERASVRQAVGYFAAPIVADWLHSNMIVGVAGSRTLASLVEHIKPQTTARGISFVQLMGNFGAQVSSCDAAELSRRFAEKLNGTYYSLNAPAVAADADSCRAFLSHQDVQTIHGLYGVMEMAFVGIGSLEDSTFIERGVITPDEVSRLVAHGAIGELCGRFFDSQGQACDPGYQERVVGIRLEELQQKPDVVAVTMGRGRAQALYSALKSRVVTSLVIDEDGAQALLDFAGSVDG